MSKPTHIVIPNSFDLHLNAWVRGIRKPHTNRRCLYFILIVQRGILSTIVIRHIIVLFVCPVNIKPQLLFYISNSLHDLIIWNVRNLWWIPIGKVSSNDHQGNLQAPRPVKWAMLLIDRSRCLVLFQKCIRVAPWLPPLQPFIFND